jgi:hypothetical protein
MAKRCLIEACKREAETYCYHCSQDVCGKHFLEHKTSIVEQLNPLIDEVNLIYDRIQHHDQNESAPIPQCLIDAHNQLDKWREECHHHIDVVYRRARSEITMIGENFKKEESGKAAKILELLKKMRQQLEELLKEGDVTYRQLETLKLQLNEVKMNKEEQISYPDIRIATRKIDVDKYVSVNFVIERRNETSQKLRTTWAPDFYK